jgi:hypothetical protein
VAAVEDQQPVKTRSAGGSDEPLREDARLRRSCRQFAHLATSSPSRRSASGASRTSSGTGSQTTPRLAGVRFARAGAREKPSSSCSLAVTRWAIAMAVAGVLPSLRTMWTWPNPGSRTRCRGRFCAARRLGRRRLIEGLRALHYHVKAGPGCECQPVEPPEATVWQHAYVCGACGRAAWISRSRAWARGSAGRRSRGPSGA